MIESLMRLCNNYFESTVEEGDYALGTNFISGVRGSYAPGQYIRIMESCTNDGVYKVRTQVGSTLHFDENFPHDENFAGYIVGLRVPKDFVSLATKIGDFNKKSEKHAGVSSESIPNYSVSYDKSSNHGAQFYQTEVRQFQKPWRPVYDFLKWVKHV